MTRSHLETASSARVDLEQRGYVIARGLLPLDLLEELQKKVTAELTSLHVSTGELTEQHQPVFVPTGDDPIEAALLPRTSRDEILEEIFQSPEALEFVRQLFDGSAVFSHPTKWMRALPPASSDIYSPPDVHQDFPELQGSANQLTMWTPVFPVGPETGSLPVYLRPSFKHVLPLTLDSGNPSGWRIRQEFLHDPYVPDLQPGDALIFNTFTPHGGASNSGSGWRVSVEARYQPLDEPICIQHLSSPLQFPSWDALYEGWSKYGHYWAKRQPEVIQFDDSWERWRDIEALDQGCRGNPEALVALRIAERFAKSPSTRSRAADLMARNW
jgi:ectoine hydroxylase-related dioxygenase (phytanoyl-CoA dioxygenase family)